MKNFKKVISAVIALAMSISTFASASSFTDVADTHANAEAIDVLASLGIITGYEENGTFVFKPEGTITRAEAATMIVGALNMTEDAKASAGTSQFADVNTQASWAAGYINVGVAQGFISGMDATTFAPQDNVTYAQMCVMLTSIAGYGEYAKTNGGYPTGYTNMAASTGINKGVAVGNDVALTRGQVAQMIWNALQTPMLGVYEYSITGNSYTQLDGSTKVGEFKTLLSDKFDGYVVTGTISATATSDGLDADTAKVTITKADWWGDAGKKITAASDYDYNPVEVKLDGLNVNDALHQSGKAIITEDDFGDFHLVYFATTGKTDTKTFDAADYVLQEDLGATNKFTASNKKVRFGSRYYTLADNVAIYVNGVEQTAIALASDDTVAEVGDELTIAQTTLDNTLGNAVGTITLIDGDETTGYEKILVDIYNVGKVAAVEYENSETVVTIITKEAVATEYDEIVITDEAIEDGDTIMSVTKNGSEVELTALAKDDIIAYKADFKNNTDTTLKDPKEITILATNDTVSGKVTAKDTDEETYSIDGTAYEYVTGLGSLTVGETYTATLDPFGRIYSTEKDGSSTKMAIALTINSNDQLKLLLADGTTKTYEIASSVKISGFGTNTVSGVEDYLADSDNKAVARVVEYTVRTSSQEITKIALQDASDAETLTTAEEYNGRTNRLGGYEILSTTPVIDATEATAAPKQSSSYSSFNAESFKDGSTYKFAAWKSGT
ncbi:MAG: S-layer homology domain-containing protein, partial [Clostridia bacterium]|nr:S-layer homology domain-containing protein [Clostridia bacterium]